SVGIEQPDAVATFLPGLDGRLEQADDLHRVLSSVASLANDQAGYGADSTTRSAELTRWLIFSLLIVAIVIVLSALLANFALEARDVARYMPGQTFARVGDARIRYQLLGAEHPGATVVILSGLNGSIEQLENIQRALSCVVPALVYDRAGYGFSEGSTAHSAE